MWVSMSIRWSRPEGQDDARKHASVWDAAQDGIFGPGGN